MQFRLEAMERDEILRTRRFCLVAVAVAIAGASSVPLLPGDPTATMLLLSAVGVAMMAIDALRSHGLPVGSSLPLRVIHQAMTAPNEATAPKPTMARKLQ